VRRTPLTTWMIDNPQRLVLDGEVRQLDVWLACGKLNVVGADGPARLEVNRVGRRGVTVTLEGGVLSVRHEINRRFGWLGPIWWFGVGRRRYYADLSVAVPRSTTISLTVTSGSVVASALTGGASVDVVSGGITLSGLQGRIRAKTVSGSVKALGAAGNLSIETVSGEITLAGTTAERIHARAVSGAITCDVDNPYPSEIRLDTISGAITTRVPVDADLEVNLGATSGRIFSAFTQVRPSGPPGARSARGRLGAGAGQLSAYAVSGNVSLLARPTPDPSEQTDPARGGLSEPSTP
jgi:putative adhesin